MVENAGPSSFPVTLFSLFPPPLFFSSPVLLESPLSAELRKKEPNHPKKKGPYPCRRLNTHSPLIYAQAHKIRKELLLFDDFGI